MNRRAPAHLPKDVTGQRLVQAGVAVDEREEVQAGAVLLHHQLEEALVLKHVQDLGRDSAGSGAAETPADTRGHHLRGAVGAARPEPRSTLMMLACSTLDRIAISNVTFPSLGSSTQQSSRTFSFLMNFTTT